MLSIEVQLHEALEQIKTKDVEILQLKAEIHKRQIRYAELQRDWRLKEAGLTADAITRLHAAFATSTDNAGLKQAINTEKRNHGKA